jgi:hypothetical protein
MIIGNNPLSPYPPTSDEQINSFDEQINSVDEQIQKTDQQIDDLIKSFSNDPTSKTEYRVLNELLAPFHATKRDLTQKKHALIKSKLENETKYRMQNTYYDFQYQTQQANYNFQYHMQQADYNFQYHMQNAGFNHELNLIRCFTPLDNQKLRLLDNYDPSDN